MSSSIRVTGVRQNNLTGWDLELPRGALVVVTGVSGSGKSSLAYDVLFQEGQRRYLQTFSGRARRHLERLARAEVERATGLSPAVAVGQVGAVRTPRSTVGTLSELYDHLRLLFARVGVGGPQPVSAGLFSFNGAQGACPQCRGLGLQDDVDPALLVADGSRTLRQGALVPTTPNGYIVYSQVTVDVLDQVCRAHGFDVDTPWDELSEAQQGVVMHGSRALKVPFGKHPLESRLRWKGITARPRQEGFYRGLVPVLRETLLRNRNTNVLRFVRSGPCAVCGGSRLGPEALAVRVAGLHIAAVAALTLDELLPWLHALPGAVAAAIRAPLQARIAALQALGLGHLSLDRPSALLGVGDVRRIRLAAQAAAGLHGVLFVLDEPTVGLHSRDTGRLCRVLRSLVQQGNTVVVVEHDPQVLRAADWVVDLGPAAGRDGGRLLFSGPPAELLALDGPPDSATRRCLLRAPGPPQRAPRPSAGVLTVRGARARNLKGLDVSFRLGALNVVTGVSGAGKSTLVGHVLGQALRVRLHGAQGRPGEHDAVVGAQALRRVVTVDQSPIGRTPRSNPATYTGLFDLIRAGFAATPQARALGYGPGRFSFNVAGGRCPGCEGAGVQTVGMHLLPDAIFPCPLCRGRRFDDATLAVTWRGLAIDEVLALSVTDALERFGDLAGPGRTLRALHTLGLGYLRLGQPSPTLSGGEAQRVKLAAELGRPSSGHGLYLLDEPTRGLHAADVATLLTALRALLDAGHTVILVEHDLDVVGAADHVVDLGPEGGAGGGQLVCAGTPAEVAASAGATGEALRRHWAVATSATVVGPREAAWQPATVDPSSALPDLPAQLPAPRVELRGVRTHNLRAVDVSFPVGGLSVVTGPSGSGKSSLAIDTLYAEGRRRFLESLSPHVRRSLGALPAAAVDLVEGLAPTVIVDGRGRGSTPRSTLATATGVADRLRLLFSRFGTPGCPSCAVPGVQGCCPQCAGAVPTQLTLSHLSFNHHLGACPACEGLGRIERCAPQRLVTHPERSLLGGALDGTRAGKRFGEPDGRHVATLKAVGAARGLDFTAPFEDLDDMSRQVAMHGTGEHVYAVTWSYRRGRRQGEHTLQTAWVGFCGLVQSEYVRKQATGAGAALRPLMEQRPCPACAGARLGAAAAAVKLRGQTLVQLYAGSVEQALGWLREQRGAAVRELRERLEALCELGIGYLQLGRSVDSLSGGEACRMRLGAQLAGELAGVICVLDEPTLGLHPRDTLRLLRVLRRLQEAGNTLVVVEHDPAVWRAADHLVDLGPGAGAAGGQVVAAGRLEDLRACPASPSGRWLRGESTPAPSRQRAASGWIEVTAAHAHNLRSVDLRLPCGSLVALTGVSGSGKSTLLLDVLAATAAAGAPQGCSALQGLDAFAAVRTVDAAPLGASSVSTPATSLGLLDPIRALFARTAAAQARGWTRSRFSYTRAPGQCPTCKGSGELRVALDFLADVGGPCPACGGARYTPETLEVRWRDHSVADVLALSVQAAASLFADQRAIAPTLEWLQRAGLGYLRLGQAAPTLSGGEAQRIRLVAGLRGADSGPALVLLDEPTRGLHPLDVTRLIALLQGLVDAGHTVVAVEHDLQLIRSADWIVDLGPEGGPGGGQVVACGPPEEVRACSQSATGRALLGPA